MVSLSCWLFYYYYYANSYTYAHPWCLPFIYHIQAALHVLCPFLCLSTYREGLIQGLNETKLVVLDTQVCIPSTSRQKIVKDGWPKVWLPTPRRMYFVGYTQFTSHCVGYTQFTPSNTVSFTGGVYLIPFDLKCSVLTLLLYPFNPNFRSWYKEETKYIKPSRMHTRCQLLVYISSRRGRTHCIKQMNPWWSMVASVLAVPCLGKWLENRVMGCLLLWQRVDFTMRIGPLLFICSLTTCCLFL